MALVKEYCYNKGFPQFFYEVLIINTHHEIRKLSNVWRQKITQNCYVLIIQKICICFIIYNFVIKHESFQFQKSPKLLYNKLLLICNVGAIGIQISFRHATPWFDVSTPYRVVRTPRAGTVPHWANCSPSYWPYSPSRFSPILPPRPFWEPPVLSLFLWVVCVCSVFHI